MTQLRVEVLGDGVLAGGLLGATGDHGIVVSARAAPPGPGGPVDLVVVAVDDGDPDTLREASAACLEAGVGSCPVIGMGPVVQLGPLTRPGDRPCLACVDLRVWAATRRSVLDGPWPADRGVLERVASGLLADVRRLSDDGDDPAATFEYRWGDGSRRRHTALRTIHCDQCALVEPLPTFVSGARPRRGASPDPTRILTVQDRLVDPVAGPVTALRPARAHPRDPAVHHVVATLVDPGWVAAGFPTVDCGGNDLDPDRATAAALGEALDRAASSQPPDDLLEIAAYDDVRGEAIDPASWDLFRPETRGRPGFPYVPIVHDQPISWVRGWCPEDGHDILVPAVRVFSPFRPVTPADLTDAPLISGFATGSTLEEAAVAAVLEVVERDTFTIAWANQVPLRPVDVDALDDPTVHAYVAAFRAVDLEVRCRAVTLDLGVPTVVALVRSPHPEDPATVVAAAAHLDLARACVHALKELTANLANVRHHLAAARDHLPGPDPDEVRTETAHGLLYARRDMAPALEPWWQPRLPTHEVPASPDRSPVALLAELTERIAAAGLRLIVVDLTPPGVAELGLATVKALVPGTYPMDFDATWPHDAGRRLTHAPVRAGVTAAARPRSALTRVPHPFP